MLSSAPSFEIGARVRWRPEIAKTDWVGEVTGHPCPRMVQCDGLGSISVGLLERVGEMTEKNPSWFEEQLRTERDTLAEVVASQCELIMDLQSAAPVPAKFSDAWFEGLLDRLELYLVRQTGSRRPLTIADADLRALVAHIRE